MQVRRGTLALRPTASTARSTRLLPLAVAAAALAVYAATLQRTLPAGDSGELIAVAWGHGVAHPPGYPLYTLIAGAWVRLCPWGEPALRLALLSALCQAAAAGLLAAALRRLGAGLVAAAGAAVLWAFCAPAWKTALVAEVFALNSLLAAALWLSFATLLAAGDPRGHRRALAALLALTVLGLSHHHTLFILALPLDVTALIVWLRRGRPGCDGKFMAMSAAVALACLTPLLTLMLPPGLAAPVWGRTSTWAGLWHHLLRRDYGTFSLDPAGAGYAGGVDHVRQWLASAPHAIGYPGLLLVVAGLVVLMSRAVRGSAGARPVLAAAVGMLVLQGLFFTRVGYPLEPAHLRGVVERFQALPAMTLAVLAGLALAAPVGRWRSAAVLPAIVAAAWPLGLHWRTVDQHDNTFHADTVHNVLVSVPLGAALFVQGDLLHNGLAYAVGVQGQRPDLAWADQELMTYAWYVKRLRAREPELLPPLDRADRVQLADGRTLAGRLREGPADSLPLLTLAGWRVLDAAQAVQVERDLAPDIFAMELAAEGHASLLTGDDDRYSGLPGSQNVFWLDRLTPRRVVAMSDFKDESFRRYYTAVPRGLVQVMAPIGSEPSLAQQARDAADLLAQMRLDSWFRPQDPWSFEATSREQVVAFITATATLMARPEAASIRRADHPGLDVLANWLARYRREVVPGDPRLDYASGFLHLLHPDFSDLEVAAADLARLRETARTDPAAAQAADALAAALRRAHEFGGN